MAKSAVVDVDSLRDILEEVIDISEVEIRAETVLGDELPLTSSEMLRVLARLQSRFQRRFSPADILRVRTVGDLLELLNSG